jgi:hypothetical protein
MSKHSLLKNYEFKALDFMKFAARMTGGMISFKPDSKVFYFVQ